MSFKEFLGEAKIFKNFKDVGSSLVKRFDRDESKKIVKALKKNPQYSSIKQIVDSMTSDDAEYSDVLTIELNDGAKFTLYGFEGYLRMGGDSGGLSKRFEINAVTAEQLVKELPEAKIK